MNLKLVLHLAEIKYTELQSIIKEDRYKKLQIWIYVFPWNCYKYINIRKNEQNTILQYTLVYRDW